MSIMNSNIFDRFSLLSLFVVVVLLPIFSLPFTNVPIEIAKGLLLVVGLTVSVVLWAMGRFFEGKIVLPKSWLLVSGLMVALAVLLSALFSGTIPVSLFGVMFDLGSFWFIFAAILLMLWSATLFHTPQQARLLLFGLALSSMLLLVFQAARLFLPEVLSLGMLGGKTGNIFGTWNALGLFVGFSALMFLLVAEFFSVSKSVKIILQVFILLAVLFAAVVNFSLVWILLGISSLIIFVYKASISFGKKSDPETTAEEKRFPTISFVVVLISLLFFTSGQFIISFIPDRLQVPNREVSPSLATTFSVGRSVVAEDPVFGLGPNRFGEAWAMHKPRAINDTDFWGISFDSGSGTLPTLLALTGILGVLSWLLFFVLFLGSGAKLVSGSIKSGSNWEIVAFFVLSLYLFVSLFFYSAGAVILILAFAFAGVFVGLAADNAGRIVSFSFLNDHRKSFFSIFGLIVLVFFSVILTFKYLERFASVVYLRKALLSENVAQAESFINKAVALNYNDLYLRTYSGVYIVKLNSIASKKEALSEADKAALQASFDQAVSGAELAVKYNPRNWENFQTLGRVYETAGVLKVEGANAKAIAAYGNAGLLNPLNPAPKLGMARAALADGKRSDALAYAEEALALVPNNKDIQDYVNSLQSETSAPVAPAPETTTNE